MVSRDWNPAEAAIGLSWTLSFDVACWFAIQRGVLGPIQERRGGRPFVFSLMATADEIITLHQGGTAPTEYEVLV
jgi:hypothetical protein